MVSKCPLAKRKLNRGWEHLVLRVNICTMSKQEPYKLQFSPSSMLPYAAELLAPGPVEVVPCKNRTTSK